MGATLDYNPNSFFIFDHGIVGSFRRLRASVMSMRSSNASRNSKSSIGTTAATGFLRRCTTILSPPYAARFKMSAKFCRVVLAVSVGDIGHLDILNVHLVQKE